MTAAQGSSCDEKKEGFRKYFSARSDKWREGPRGGLQHKCGEGRKPAGRGWREVRETDRREGGGFHLFKREGDMGGSEASLLVYACV